MATQMVVSSPETSRLSRYRSQRKAMVQTQTSQPAAVPTMPSQPMENEAEGEEQLQQEATKQTIQRSMSRYRNARLPASLVTAMPVPSIPSEEDAVHSSKPAIGMPMATPRNISKPGHGDATNQGAGLDPAKASEKTPRYHSSDIMMNRIGKEQDVRRARREQQETAKEEARLLANIEQERQRRIKEKSEAQKEREVVRQTVQHRERKHVEEAVSLEEANRRHEEWLRREREQAEEAERLRKQRKYELARAQAKRQSLLRKQQDTDLNERVRRERAVQKARDNPLQDPLQQSKRHEANERSRELQQAKTKDGSRSQAENFERRRRQKNADMERELVENEKAAEKARQEEEQRRLDELTRSKDREREAAEKKVHLKRQLELEKQSERNQRAQERKGRDTREQQKQVSEATKTEEYHNQEAKKLEHQQAEQRRRLEEQQAEEMKNLKKVQESTAKTESIPPPLPPPPAVPALPAEEPNRSESIRRKMSVVRPSTARAPPQTPILEEESAMPRPSTSKDRLTGLLKKRKPNETAPSTLQQSTKDRRTSSSNVLPDNTLSNGSGLPGMDAPISASNAGERRIKIECGKSVINLPVTNTTTPVDLLRSASTILSESFNPKCSLLIEEFGKVGVQRPLRKYEYIRDVMNSWDYDAQHALVVIPQAGGFDNPDLEVANVPDEQPLPFSCNMMYSQRPGKWENRYVTLRADGQMVQTKKAGSPETNVCHLSDFDIYQPMAKQSSTKIKPPKKHCFAIKSQQKSNMFMTTEMFVHFFCTGDKRLGGEFYGAVQKWRSWYLVHVLGEGQKKKKFDTTASSDQLSGARQMPGSRDSHYQLGSFQPLFDLDMFNTIGDTSESKRSVDAEGRTDHSRNASQLSKSGPPSAFAKWFTDPGTQTRDRGISVTQSSHSRDDDNTFAPTGLLGRSYSQRQKQQVDREIAAKNESPFTVGPSLLNKGLEQGRPSIDQDRPSLDIRRGPSTRKPGMPRPLVDLSAGINEAPQEHKKGKGFVPDTVGPGGLVDNATSPDMAIAIPNDWRTRTETSNGSGPYKSRSGHRAADSNGQLLWDKEEQVQQSLFLQDGLLAHTQGLGTGTTGKGVMTGYANAKSPLIDMQGASQYQVGSLLEKVEKNEGGPGPKAPIISRGKGEEVDVETGEGL